MKYFATIILFFLFSNTALSTQRAYHNYLYPYSNFSFCFNGHYPFDSIEYLYYKGLSSTLNEYIISRVNNGSLKNRKFEIQTGCEIFGGHPSIEVSRNKRGYFVFIHGSTNLYQMAKIINYFSSNAWKSFCYNIEKTDPIIALSTFNTILNNVVEDPDLRFFDHKEKTVWELDNLKMIYHMDKLFYEIDGMTLNFQPSPPLPAKLKDRYFFVNNGRIQVFEKGTIILEQMIPDYDNTEPLLYTMEAYRKWLNFFYGGHPIFSYAYHNNRFYKIQSEP